MTPERWEHIANIYSAALELHSAERIAFLDEICSGDDSLRFEVESLLKANSEAGDFIAKPAISGISTESEAKAERYLVGQNLGHYRVISPLGSGGMGEVYLAEDLKLGRKVALKTLPKDYRNELVLQRFKNEARAAATLNHPNIATLYSVEEEGDCSFLTMEYVEGKTLSELIPTGGMDVKVLLKYLISITEALAHSHEKGIIHRDIKPGNIMITNDGVPKILDFGLARIDRNAVSDKASTLKMTQPGQVIGTPSYMSPEQAEGKDVDLRTDIFSLGVVIYEAITGERPFTGDSYATIVSNLLKTEPPSVSEVKPETPYLLARLTSRCLSKSRDKRFQTMREVVVILEEIQAALEAGVSMDSLANRLLPKAEKSYWAWIYSVAALLIVGTSVFAYYFFQDTSPPMNLENMLLRRLSQTNNVTYVQITPDGKSIAYFTLEDDSTRSIWIRRVEDKNALRLVSNELRQFWGGIGISPDGSQIFYSVADENARFGTLYKISSLGGTPRKLIENANDVGSVSSDGQRILFVRRNPERLQIISANTADGSDERIVHTGEPDELFRDPKFSADDKSVFYSERKTLNGRSLWSLIEIPVEGGVERTILETNGERIGELAVLKDGSGILINKGDDTSILQQLFHVSIADGKEKRLTNDLNSYHGISVSDDGNTIAAAQNLITRDIWIMKSGETPRKITSEPNVYSSACFTPDGRIVYDATDNNRPQIWIMNGDGSNPQQLTPNDSFNFEPQISPDGRYIIFTSDRTGENKIWRMNLDGSSSILLTNATGPAFAPIVSSDSTVWFQWIKDNKQILAKIPVAGGEPTMPDPSFGSNQWAISPDGKKVALAFFDEESKRFKLRVRPVDAEEPSKIFDIATTNVLEWTADGNNLLYRSLEPGTEMLSAIWQLPLSGGKAKQFLSVKPDRVSAITQSADGKQTLFIRTKTSSDAILLTKTEK